jgi:hypothetical protein
MMGRSMGPERASAHAQAIAEALGRLGEPITEAQAREIAVEQQCDCQEGMFALAPTRRGLLGRAGLIAAVGATAMLPRTSLAKAPPGAVEYQVPEDPTKESGRLMGVDGGYGSRSQFETDVRWVNPTRTASFTPLQASYGTITPSGLHYERHYAGIPNIDPARHRLTIHGLVDRPIKYSLADLKRFPTVSRTYFLECSGTTGSEIMKAREPTVATDPWACLDVGVDWCTAIDAVEADRTQVWCRVGIGRRLRRRSDDPQRADRQMPLGCAYRVCAERRGYPPGTGLSDASFSAGLGGQHLDQMAAKARGQR